MKTWTNPTVEELEVEMTAGGIPLTRWEEGYLPGPEWSNKTETNS